MRNKLVVIGSLNYDIIMKLPYFPKVGETLTADDAVYSAGGKGANQAVQAAKLGIPTYMAGCVGRDSNGEFLIHSITRYGVNAEHIHFSDTPTGIGVVNAIPGGRVTATITRGANYSIERSDINALKNLFAKTALVILQMEIPLEINMYAIDKAKACGCKVLLNAAPASPIGEDYLKKIDFLVVNEVEAAFYIGKELNSVDEALASVREMRDRLGTDCVFTLGKQGAVMADHETTAFIPSLDVNAVETTGAGDSFIGALGHALLHGKNLEDACRFATKCSAITVCRYGAQPAMPVLEEITF